jgi:hypothetical protein
MNAIMTAGGGTMIIVPEAGMVLIALMHDLHSGLISAPIFQAARIGGKIICTVNTKSARAHVSDFRAVE